MRMSITAAAFIASLVLSASAADLPYRGVPLIAPPPPVMSWTGFYIGANVGGTFGGSSAVSTGGLNAIDNNSTLDAAFGGPVFPGQGAAISSALTNIFRTGSRAGAVLGGQAGYNYQFATSFVAGIEADIQGVIGSRGNGVFANGNAAGAALGGLAAPAPFVTNAAGAASRRLDYFGTVRARLGYSFAPSFLAYVTGGLAYGGVKSNISTVTSFPGTLGNGTFGTNGANGSAGSYANTRVGYTIGGGVEWMFAPSWSVKAEYLYYNLGTISYNGGITSVSNAVQAQFIGQSGLLTQTVTRVRFRQDGHVARVGFNYHFALGDEGGLFR